MAMYSRIQENDKEMLPPESLSTALDGNFCRCTGYQPLWNAARSLCKGTKVNQRHWFGAEPEPEYQPVKDDPVFPKWLEDYPLKDLVFKKEGKEWYRPTSLESLEALVAANQGRKMKLTGGNQLMIFPWLEHDKMDVFIDVKGVREFHELKTTPEGIEIGAAVTITNLRNLLKRLISSEKEPASRTNGFETLHHHLSKVASTNLRNSGTVLGNLMACGSKAFPSDIATPFMVLDATVTLHTGEAFLLEDFLREGNFDGKIVTRISLPYRKEGTFFNVFKVMKRPQNCISDINAAFSFTPHDGVIKAAIAMFGGSAVGIMDPDMVLGAKLFPQHAAGLEEWMIDKKTSDLSSEAISEAAKIAVQEISIVTDHYTQYRSSLVAALTYKALSDLISGEVTDLAAKDLQHADDVYRLKPLPDPKVTDMDFSMMTYNSKHKIENNGIGGAHVKLTAPMQAAGEMKYADDMDAYGSVNAYYVHSTEACAKIISIDTSFAETMPGFICYMDAKVTLMHKPGPSALSP